MGLCSNLLERVVKFLKTTGKKIVYLGVDGDNIAALKCYQKVGFVIFEERKNIKGEQEYIMKMDLGQSFSEISQNTGVSDRTVRRNFKKTLKFFADSLEKEGFY